MAKMKIYLLPLFLAVFSAAFANDEQNKLYGIQAAWDNPTANMAKGSIKPGYAQLPWSTGTVLPVKLRNGMATLISLPNLSKE